jgi:hypothetical protein
MEEVESSTSSSDVAVTERGRPLPHYSDAEIDAALRTLILTGSVAKASRTLIESGLQFSEQQLRHWRDHAFANRHYRLRRELANDVGEEVAGRAMEQALQEDEAERLFVERALDRLDEIPTRDLAASARNMAQAKALDVTKAQLLRDRPTEIKETRSVPELLAVLKDAGVLRVSEADNTILGLDEPEGAKEG